MAAALEPTEYFGEIVWLGSVVDPQRTALIAEGASHLDLTFAGIPGSVHMGETRPSCSRVTKQYKRKTEIRNVRQLSIVSEEELLEIAARMKIDYVDPARLGASLMLKGIPDFTHIPPSSRLQTETGVTVTVDMENLPCAYPARSLETVHPGHGKGFTKAASGRRGVTAWVERPGTLRLGDLLRLHVPAQRGWAPAGPSASS